MKNFQFNRISILSRKERGGIQVSFHHGKNLIVGLNHTGKSSLIRSLFEVLGAKPSSSQSGWDDGAMYLLEFTANDIPYKCFYRKGYRILFDKNGNAKEFRNDSLWRKEFCRITGFNLIMKDKNDNAIEADSSIFFLLFYINQNGSWSSSWATFLSLARYKDFWKDAIGYFLGIKPSEYYDAKVARDLIASRKIELSKEKGYAESARKRVVSLAEGNLVPLTESQFSEEISRITHLANDVYNSQRKCRSEIYKLERALSEIEAQIKLSEYSLQEYRKDRSYIMSDKDLVCPTCGTHHQDSFLDYVDLAENAHFLEEILIDLKSDRESVVSMINQSKKDMSKINKEYEEIQTIMRITRNGLMFGDILKGMGMVEAIEVLNLQVNSIGRDIIEMEKKMQILQNEIDRFDNRPRKNDIKSLFSSSYYHNIESLNVNKDDIDMSKFDRRPSIGGSAGARAVLAYYAALWEVCFSPFGGFRVPVVIDSPNQQAQDLGSLRRINDFISSLKINHQSIIASEYEIGVNFDKVIFLHRERGLLDGSKFEELEAFMSPYLGSVGGSTTTGDLFS